MFELGISVFERYQGGKYTEEMRPLVEFMLNKRVVVKLLVDRVVSWDHRKLNMPSTSPEESTGRSGGRSRWPRFWPFPLLRRPDRGRRAPPRSTRRRAAWPACLATIRAA